MAFVKELISKEDLEKYGLDIIPDRLHGLGNPSRKWTIDTGKQIWLRLFYAQQDHTADTPGYTGNSIWDFYWKGILMSVATFDKETKPASENNNIYYAYIELNAIDIPDALLSQKAVVLRDLKQALAANFEENSILDMEYQGKLV